MNHYEIVRKLIGPVTSVGDSGIDTQRLENLKETMDLVEKLLGDIQDASNSIHNHQASMKKIGEVADKFLREVAEEYQ